MRRRRRRARLRDLASSLLAFLFTNVGVVVLVFAYTVAGAFMFQAIEGASELEREYNMTMERDSTVRILWNFSQQYNNFQVNEATFKERVSVELREYQYKIVREWRRGWHGTPRRWTFSSAFLYSLTVITTIGYGHLSPHTKWGKVITIFYALLGMPLFLLYLANVGELLARWFKCLYALACLCRGCPGFRRRVPRLPAPVDVSEVESIERPEAWRAPYFESRHSLDRDPYVREHYGLPTQYRSWDEARYATRWEEDSDFTYVTFDAQTITVPISVCVFILVGYIIFGSMIFGMWEKWDQLDGAYFCFISLSSIGFGDFVPGEHVMTPRIETSFIVCSLYLMLGMALVAMCFNLMQEQVIHYFAGLKRALKRLCRCKR